MEIVTANRLSDGRVVFMTRVDWSTSIDQAEVLESKPAVEAALARAAADAAGNRVVDVYAIGVVRENGSLVPTRLRERIRAEGPTTGNSKHQRAADVKAA